MSARSLRINASAGGSAYAAAPVGQTTARHSTVASGAESECAIRGLRGQRIVVDDQLEGAEMALRRAYRAAHHRIFSRAHLNICGRLDQHGDIEQIFDLLGGFDRLRVA